MTVAEYIVKFLRDQGVDTVFMVTGGQAMFLNDAVYNTPGIKGIFNHHEQAAGMAAEAYGRVSGRLGVAMVTAGPGAINVLNGVVGAFVDSAPMMVISGQSAYSTVSYMQQTKIRQHGLQGTNIAPVAKTMTKFFKTVDDPAKIQSYMQEAFYEATTGRTGPVWIEVPLDIQRMEVPLRLLDKFSPQKKFLATNIEKKMTTVLEMIYKSQRPLILAGQGIKIAKANKELLSFIKKFKIPVLTTRLGIDLISSDSKYFAGRPGLYPDRAANFAIQNADLILTIGARLDIGVIGYDANDWGRHAKKIVVDIDLEELNKPGILSDLAINADAKVFLSKLNNYVNVKKLPSFESWRKICLSWKKKYPMVLPEYRKSRLVNSYYFTEVLSNLTSSNDNIVVDTSSPFHVVCQTWKIKRGQSFLTTGGISTMGYWPSAIGVCYATGRRRTIVVTGDGCLQMNIQELAVLKASKLPIKVFVINNKGYLLIRHTQKTHLGGRYMGESPKTGLYIPNIMDIAKAYGILGIQINSASELVRKIKRALAHPGPVLVDVKSPEWQLIIPRISSSRQQDGSMKSRPYEDLFPFLEEKELKANMIAEKDE